LNLIADVCGRARYGLDGAMATWRFHPMCRGSSGMSYCRGRYSAGIVQPESVSIMKGQVLTMRAGSALPVRFSQQYGPCVRFEFASVPVPAPKSFPPESFACELHRGRQLLAQGRTAHVEPLVRTWRKPTSQPSHRATVPRNQIVKVAIFSLHLSARGGQRAQGAPTGQGTGGQKISMGPANRMRGHRAL
jgi:hypothetical protein